MALRDYLHSWLSDQPTWQQDLARRLVSCPQLDGAEYDAALRMVKSAHGALADGETAPAAPTPVTLDDLPADATKGAPRLTGFGRMRGVGAVSPEHELRFAATGLTVIYGQNAVGKTTYVRALKRVCRAVDCDALVRGNVFAAVSAEAPTAKVKFEQAGATRAQQLDLTNPEDLGLDAISVFDSQCAELYVDEENAVAFVPVALRVLPRLAMTQDQMRRDLKRQADALEREVPTFPELPTDTAAGRFAATLSADTSLDELRALARLSVEERARRPELRAVLASAQSHNARADAEAAREDARQAKALLAALRDLAERVDEPARGHLGERAREAASAHAAVNLATREFFELPVTGIGGGVWRRLWEAARAFAEQGGAAFPPPASTACPLCVQGMSEDAAARLARFEEHVHSAVQEAARQASETLHAELDRVADRHADACQTMFLEGLRERDAALHAAIERYLASARSHLEVLRADPAGACVVPLEQDVLEQLEAWADARARHGVTLLVAAEDPEQEKALKAERAELDARERLAARLPDAEKCVRAKQRVAALRAAHSALATNRITSKQRQLSEEVVTGALDITLKQELVNLDCEHIPVHLHPETHVGETSVALRLAGARGTPKVSEIASEGEQRALSLSFFLAEVSISEGDGGIVVDDPVSSLDDERRDYIATRLVAETAKRQVIVFTHDLPFMLDLLDRAEDAGVEPVIQGVWRMGDEVGRVDDHPPFKAMKLKSRISALTLEVQEWNNQLPPHDLDAAWRRVCDFYARMRTTWERAVEERLFNGVVARFQREVKTLALDQVNISPEKVALVKEGMTRCSKFVHDEAPAASMNLPGRTQLAQDLAKLQDFEKLTKK
jgi:energy-coupling factor transporter ATP-binding protein EcfA2